jgi:hypothetical protein
MKTESVLCSVCYIVCAQSLGGQRSTRGGSAADIGLSCAHSCGALDACCCSSEVIWTAGSRHCSVNQAATAANLVQGGTNTSSVISTSARPVQYQQCECSTLANATAAAAAERLLHHPLLLLPPVLALCWLTVASLQTQALCDSSTNRGGGGLSEWSE